MTFSNFAAHALVTTALAMTAIHGVAAQNPAAVLTTAEIITPSDSPVPGGTIYYNESVIRKFTLLQRDSGNGQLAQDFVYGDPRNALFDGGNPDITFAIAEENTSDDENLENQNWWLEESLRIWESQVCSISFLTRAYFEDPFSGIVKIFFDTGKIPLIQIADVAQIGFLSPEEFPFFAANPNVLGVAFTLSWVDQSGNLTDIDENGKADVAFREIYYNDAFEWSDNGVGGERGSGIIDFPTVAIHEAGHGLSADHFGSIGRRGDALVANPRAIMNAIYGGPLRHLTGRDEAAHCSNWSQWPLH
jgi:hypothetical protein